MTPLSDALQASQSAALAALARSYVRGPLGASEDATEALAASLDRIGQYDLAARVRLDACRPSPAELDADRQIEPEDE